jgi:hypothetical protein
MRDFLAGMAGTVGALTGGFCGALVYALVTPVLNAVYRSPFGGGMGQYAPWELLIVWFALVGAGAWFGWNLAFSWAQAYRRPPGTGKR